MFFSKQFQTVPAKNQRALLKVFRSKAIESDCKQPQTLLVENQQVYSSISTTR
jgi:hypothetical protein